MNILYVTVSMSLILILAGFNHAHGLTTFGKTNTMTNSQPPPARAKQCGNQSDCATIKATTCIKGSCLCGDNTVPINGNCKAEIKGPGHICSSEEECVQGADCVPVKDTGKPGPISSQYKVCTCQEGLIEFQNTCGGCSTLKLFPGLLLFLALLSKLLN